MKANIGFVLNEYHTELLDFLFELVHQNYNIILYIEHDDYNNLFYLKKKFKFIQKSYTDNFKQDYENNLCFKYLILSHTEYIVHQIKIFNLNIDKMLFLVHVPEEMKLLESSFNSFNYFIVSNQLQGDILLPISNSPFLRLNDYNNLLNKVIHIVKIGWVNNVDKSIYSKILNLQNVYMTIFTQGMTDDLDYLLKKHKNISIHFEKNTQYIYNYIVSNNVKFVFHLPNSVGIWSGSISFALNNNLTLITNDEAISNYNIPKEYCLSYDIDSAILQTELDNRNFIDIRDENILQIYKNKVSIQNLSVLENKLHNNNKNINVYIEKGDKRIRCNGHAYQDVFVLNANKYKGNGYFVEIGSAWPEHTNNTYILEKEFGWRGIMIEYDPKYLESYKKERPNSIHVIQDATEIDYLELFRKNNVPENVDYLQIDLEVDNESTLKVIKLFDKYIFDHYKFATITFEHDFYRGDYYNTRYLSRQILHKRGYVLLFPDVGIGNDTKFSSFEDWWVHPDLIHEEFIKKHYNNNNVNALMCSEIINKF